LGSAAGEAGPTQSQDSAGLEHAVGGEQAVADLGVAELAIKFAPKDY